MPNNRPIVTDPIKRKEILLDLINTVDDCYNTYKKMIQDGPPSNLTDEKVVNCLATLNVCIQDMTSSVVAGFGISEEAYKKAHVIEYMLYLGAMFKQQPPNKD